MIAYKCPYCDSQTFALRLVEVCDEDRQPVLGQPVAACKCGKTVIPYMGESQNSRLMDDLNREHPSLRCGKA